jgi:Domain of unknown function (DUF4326)
MRPKVIKREGRKKLPPNTKPVDRTTKYGNPFRKGPDGSQVEVVAKHRAWLDGEGPDVIGRWDRRVVLAEIPELVGKDLACHCSPEPCHGDTLLERANPAETLDHLTDADFEKKHGAVFGERGIPREVAEFDHGFARYEVQDPNGVILTHQFGMSEEHLKTAWTLSSRSRGIVMRRWAVPEAEDQTILPQLRPDTPIWTGAIKKERHSRMPKASREKHVNRSKVSREDVLNGLTDLDLEFLEEEYGDRFTVTGGADHFKVDPEIDHVHLNIAKAVFPENKSVRLPVFHDHELDPRWSEFEHDRGLSAHLQRYHKVKRRKVRDTQGFIWVGEVPKFWEIHTHWIDRDVQFYARRLSWHPWQRDERWSGKRPVLMILEGQLKEGACAAAGWATFSVPSVWQFDAPELPDFAQERLLGRRVYVVCDSDFEPGKGNRRADDDSVLAAALGARDHLRQLGVDAEMAAPTSEPAYCELHEKRTGGKCGADDSCADGRGPETFVVIEREAAWFNDLHPEESLVPWLVSHEIKDEKGAFPRFEARRNGAVILRWIAEHATPNGTTTVALRTIAKRIHGELHTKDPDGAVKDALGTKRKKGEKEPTPGYLVRWGIVETKGLEARRAWYVRKTEDWAGEVRIVAEEFRATERLPRRTIREFEEGR